MGNAHPFTREGARKKETMDTTHNTLPLVLTLMQRLARAQIETWLAGGWAEELRDLSSPRPHRDIDLLYPAANFHQVDQWLAGTNELSEITTKRFSHKRALLYEQVMVEMLLLEPQKGRHVTSFFGGRYHFIWPDDTLSFLQGGEYPLPVASPQALSLYRREHQHIEEAFQAYLQVQRLT
jgi:hypothetical protein